ncbi:MAG: glucokinase, partial [Rhodospirillales bacterium]|nr:glucokinase [Rhodospirillales bacterium]
VYPRRAAFAVASPVLGDEVGLTNHTWRFSIRRTGEMLRLDTLNVVNDFTAVALSVRSLGSGDVVAVGGGAAVPGTPIAVIGPGTGLGVSALVPVGETWVALATEGGHVTMAARDEDEDAVISWLRRRHRGHVSAERVLSGPGLSNLYDALAAVQGRQVESLPPSEITRRGLAGECDLCRASLDMFFGMLGTVVGNLVLSLGARGGVYIAGGILPRIKDAFVASRFRERFEGKGRFMDYLGPVPVWLVTHPYPAFLGLEGLVRG